MASPERLHSEVVGSLENAHQRDPRRSACGAFVRSPGPGGVGMFFWYATEEKLHRALLRDHPYARREADDEADGWPEHAVAVRAFLESGPALTPATARELSLLAKLRYRVEWWGTFDDLCDGDDDFAREVREWSRDEDDDGPLRPPEVAEFVEGLDVYGY